MRRYQAKKSYRWDPNIAYIAGLIAADGCLINDGRHLNITSKDIDLLETVRDLLLLRGAIRQKPNGFGGVGYQIQFSDVALYDFLLESGITPAKSKTIGQIKVPRTYYPDFLRGYFDGDGTVWGYWDKRWRSSLMYYTGFVSASTVFLEWLQAANSQFAGTTAGKIKPGVRAFVLTYAKADSQKLFTYMYYAHGLPALHRKKVKFIDFLGSDPYAKKELFARVAE